MRGISQQENHLPEKEFNLLEQINLIWCNRISIIKTTVVFLLVGLVIAIFSPKEYTASCVMVPQINNSSSSNLGSIAAIAGIDLGNSGNTDILSPKTYPVIFASAPFQKELMYSYIKVHNNAEPITIFEFLTKREYRDFSIIDFIKQYTIGLPGVIKGLFVSTPLPVVSPTDEIIPLVHLTAAEKACTQTIRRIVTLIVNEREGYIRIIASSNNPLVAAQLVDAIQNLLQKFITEFKIAKVQSNLEFIEERYNDIKEEFEGIQKERAIFRDGNQNMVSAAAKTELEKLDTRYSLSMAVYTELAKQLEQAKIAVKETIPTFTIIDPVSVPTERSKPRRGMIMMLFGILGVFAGTLYVFLKPHLKKLKATLSSTNDHSNEESFPQVE